VAVLRRALDLDRRAIHLLTALVVAAGVLLPGHWRVEVGPATRRAYQLAQRLRPGQAVFVVVDYGFGAQPELDPQLRAVLAHLMARGARIVIVSRSLEGSQIAQQAAREAAGRLPAYAGGYGRTWVNLGFRPAGDVPLRAATRNLLAAFNGVDYAGERVADMPIARRLGPVDRRHFALAYVFDSADGFAAMINYVTQPTGLPLVVGAIASEVPVIQPFLAAGQVAGVIPGMRGAAEYEALLGRSGAGQRALTALALVAAYVTLLIAAGNVSHLLARRNGGR
jgi:hypothetical protein